MVELQRLRVNRQKAETRAGVAALKMKRVWRMRLS